MEEVPGMNDLLTWPVIFHGEEIIKLTCMTKHFPPRTARWAATLHSWTYLRDRNFERDGFYDSEGK